MQFSEISQLKNGIGKPAMGVVACLLGGLVLSAQADMVNIGSQSGNTITDEIVAFGWIRDDSPDTVRGGETSFIGTAGSQDFRGFIAADLSLFSVGDTINSATVSLYSEGATTFNANGGIVGDATSIGLNLTQLAEITGYGSGFGDNAVLDSDGTTPATFNNISGLYGATIASVTLNLDTMAANQQVDFDVTALLQQAVDAGLTKATLGITSPDAIATGARNFFGFEGVDQGGESGSGTIGPNLTVDVTFIPEPSTLALIMVGGLFAFLRRRR